MPNTKVIPTPQFDNDVEYYIKKKRFKHLRDDIVPIIEELENGIFPGDEIQGISPKVGEHTYKVRAANTDTKVGKSNGYRIIYYAIQDDKIVYLLTLYYKKEKSTLSNKEIIKIIEKYCI